MTRDRRLIEVFTAGCPLCEGAERLVKATACKDCEVVVYDLNKSCDTGECLEKVKAYGINRVPAVVVDGHLAECCSVGPVTVEGLKAAGVGSPL
jgi:glutaredoxin